jgi:AcrR family transcriptional regulator
MPRAALTIDEIASFRDEICAVAIRLFAERGYAGVTLRGIASELGCSPMTPYRYYADKAAIFGAVRAAAFGRFADAQEEVVRRTPDPIECLQALAGAYVRFALQEPYAYRIMFELDPAPETEDADSLLEEARAWNALLGAIVHASDAGALEGDPHTLAHLCWGGLHGIVSLHLAGKLRLGRALPELSEPMLSALLDGTRARTPTPGDSR